MIAKSRAQVVIGKNCLVFAFLLFFSLIQSAFGCLSDGRYVMGTVLEITLCAEEEKQAQPTFAALFATATRFDALLTTFSSDSPLSRLNAQAGRGPRRVPAEVADVLRQSVRYWQLTGGTFDVTVGPLVALWREAGRTHILPTPTGVRQARARVGSDKITLATDSRVTLARTGMAIDLGGIGKGYALDQLVTTLKAQGIDNALLDFGQSSMWALGMPAAASGWRLLIQRPDGRSVGTITLRDQALSISASFGQSFIVNGQQYGHIIDPRHGTPLRRDLLACVVAPTATQAEALSKALLILGETAGPALLQRFPGVEGLLVAVNGRRWMTAGWSSSVTFTPSQS